jgi:hypothetical protein
MASASDLPSSTPHWSKALIRHTTLSTNTINSYIASNFAQHQLAGLSRIAADREGRGLGQHVRQQLLVCLKVLVIRLDHANEIQRNSCRTLVKGLEQGMLRVGSGIAHNHGRGFVLDRSAVEIDRLTVGFHLDLLQPGRQSGKPAVIGDQPANAKAADIAMPHGQHGQDHRQIVGQGRGPEVAVHGSPTPQKLRETLRPHHNGCRHAHRGPYRKAAAGPFTHVQDVLGRNPERFGLDRGRGDGEQAPIRVLLIEFDALPLANPPGVQQHLAGCKTLGDEDDRRLPRIDARQQLFTGKCVH